MRYIDELEGLRGVMAIWVVLGHSLAALPLIHPKIAPALGNVFAVDVFIMLSGFVIFFMINNKKQSYGVFITQRFFRIFPIYIFALVISILLMDFTKNSLDILTLSPLTSRRLEIISNYHTHPWLHIIFHFFLLQGVIPERFLIDSAYTILGQAWSVSVEWQFYLIAPFLFLCLSSIGAKRNCIFITLSVLFLLLVSRLFSDGFIGKNLASFSIGFISFFFYKNYFDKLSSTNLFYLYITISIIALLFLNKNVIPVLIWFTVIYFTLLKQKEHKNSFISSFLISKPILFLGQISYSIYMMHMIVLFFVLRLCHQINIPMYLRYIAVPVLTIFLSTIISFLTNKYIEKPMIKLGKKLTSKDRNITPANIIPQ